MPAPLGIEHFDVVEHLHLRCAAALEPVCDFTLHAREDAFHHRIVIAVATPAHATRDAGRVEDPLGVLARVRAAMVGVMEQPGVRTPALQRHVERFDREVTVVHRADGPPHDESREQIEDRARYSWPLAPMTNSVVSPTPRWLGASALNS